LNRSIYHRDQAYLCYSGDTVRLQVGLELADIALEKEDTSTARTHALHCLEKWSTLWAGVGYASGMACSLKVIVLSLLSDGDTKAALEPAIGAAALAPYERYYKIERLTQLVNVIASNLRRQMAGQVFMDMISGLLDDLAEHRGYFSYLTRVIPDCTIPAECLLRNYL
jgi:hypothetical protein